MIQSTEREYLFNFSKLKIDLDFSKIEETLIDLKYYYNTSIDSKCFRDFFKEGEVILEIMIDRDYNIFLKDYDNINQKANRMLKISYKCNEESLIFNYFQNEISLELLITEIKDVCIKKIELIILELKRISLIRDFNYWLDFIYDNIYILNIIDIEDFYYLIGERLYFENEFNSYEFIRTKMSQRLNTPSEINELFGEFLNSKNEDIIKMSKCIATGLLNNPDKYNCTRIKPYIVYALYNNLLSNAKNIQLLRLADSYYLDFFLNNINQFEGINLNENDIKKKFNLHKMKTTAILEKGITSIKFKEISDCSFLTYNLFVRKSTFEDDLVLVLLKLAKLLMFNNKIKISEKSNDCNFRIRYCTKDELVKELLKHLEVLAKLLKCNSDDLKNNILKNIY